MTTASVLLTVSTAWGANNEKCESEGRTGRAIRNVAVVAARELRETPATREQALRIMRDWINQNYDVRNIRLDDSFLLRFLRHKKFSIPMAQQTLLKYLNLRKYYPECFSNLDCDDPKIEEILNDGYIAVSPVRDANGRRVIVYNIAKFNASKFICWDICKVHVLVYECLIEDQVDQVCGFTHVGDGYGVTPAHITSWNPTDFARLMKWGEQSLPMRHKECHLINLPSAFKYITDFALSKISPKMAERLHLHNSIKNLHKHLDIACLPTSFGGPIPHEEMIKYTKSLLSEHKKKLLGLDDMQILSTRGIISSRSKKNDKDIASVQGSFRKLEID